MDELNERYSDMPTAYHEAKRRSKADLHHTWSVQYSDADKKYRIERDNSRPSQQSNETSSDGWYEVMTLRSQYDEELGQIVTVVD